MVVNALLDDGNLDDGNPPATEWEQDEVDNEVSVSLENFSKSLDAHTT